MPLAVACLNFLVRQDYEDRGWPASTILAGACATDGSDDSFPHVALAVFMEFSHHSLQSLKPFNQPSLLGDEFEQQFFNS